MIPKLRYLVRELWRRFESVCRVAVGGFNSHQASGHWGASLFGFAVALRLRQDVPTVGEG